MMKKVCDIVVTIPANDIKKIEIEEKIVNDIIANGGKGWVYWWKLPSVPSKGVVERVYFLWNGAVRAYHEVRYIDKVGTNTGGPEVILSPEINEIDPIPMKPFRGFRYFNRAGTHDKGCMIGCRECVG